MEAQAESLYHAVYVPFEDFAEDEGLWRSLITYFVPSSLIFNTKADALDAIKKYKSGRLKSFKTHKEAKEFALNGLESVLANPLANSELANPAVEDSTSKFKKPRPQQLTAFRKVIEIGDLESVRKIIWENPRYLVSSADTPAILQVGCWYNAMHVAVKVAQNAEMCELILNTVGDPEFVKLLYGDQNTNESFVDRGSVLRDLYLNTPDKALNETPLHFATKFGLKECVRTLLSYPQCMKTPLNKYSQTPAEIICTRKSVDDEQLKSEIRFLLEEQYYVPVLRAEDNSLQPLIGEPFSRNNPPKLEVSPMSPKIEVKAFAGPMTKEQALEFRKKWKTPPRILGTPNKNANCSGGSTGLRSPSVNLSLRLQDTDKGLERVGRELASEYHVDWKEYWPFLRDFTDLRCTEGLNKLEEFLKKQFEERNKNYVNLENSFKKLCQVTESKNEFEISDICDGLQSLTLNSHTSMDPEDLDDPEFITPPTSPLITTPNNDNESSDEDEMSLADDTTNEDLFLDGKTPSKIDFTVFTTIPSNIDVDKYPFTYRWRHEMQLASKKTNNNRFPQAVSSKRRLFLMEN
ncbi:hypothetical protein QAD02_012023 [Eretmocerus hayati]|uniref:Uncharacterized protein n=1 Tax=Eretmocerus hayati TaxID=131215 RepID=A0ACC2NYR5_9HYME|nr:hypothetical protein QAD02_012023 [Eretmocerus hayati]